MRLISRTMSDMEYVPVPLVNERPSEAEFLSSSREFLALMRRRRSAVRGGLRRVTIAHTARG